ncbi:histidine phosphatase family protein [Streptomyces sp. GMY02]|uniref:SixA phosphatase family protein n=1 Tax=Streptomyces sp. GMY02 TaxID=1333528 RepID=UPI001C2C9B1C|nr:histidine phosphatase family protein [Streptomyces sp. GMY02]QXE33520.1 histidine phosphatase family protein [Streptomyces sp. GMY02]
MTPPAPPPDPDPAPTRLIVLRHAKSAWPEMVADHERPLAPRGRRDAPAAGKWLAKSGYRPDLVVCSTSRRTRETWDLAAARLGTEPRLIHDRRAYEASAAELLRLVRESPRRVRTSGPVRTLLLVGHQPGVQDLVLSLAGRDEGDCLARAREKFPTSAIAVLALSGSWEALAPGTATLTDFAVPRGPKK